MTLKEAKREIKRLRKWLEDIAAYEYSYPCEAASFALRGDETDAL